MKAPRAAAGTFSGSDAAAGSSLKTADVHSRTAAPVRSSCAKRHSRCGGGICKVDSGHPLALDRVEMHGAMAVNACVGLRQLQHNALLAPIIRSHKACSVRRGLRTRLQIPLRRRTCRLQTHGPPWITIAGMCSWHPLAVKTSTPAGQHCPGRSAAAARGGACPSADQHTAASDRPLPARGRPYTLPSSPAVNAPPRRVRCRTQHGSSDATICMQSVRFKR